MAKNKLKIVKKIYIYPSEQNNNKNNNNNNNKMAKIHY